MRLTRSSSATRAALGRDFGLDEEADDFLHVRLPVPAARYARNVILFYLKLDENRAQTSVRVSNRLGGSFKFE
jgi:hypothetical protein